MKLSSRGQKTAEMFNLKKASYSTANQNRSVKPRDSNGISIPGVAGKQPLIMRKNNFIVNRNAERTTEPLN